MADTIIDGTLLNIQNIKYTSPKANPSGGKSINLLNKNTNTGLRISTPLMLTWGAVEVELTDPITKVKKGTDNFDMSLQFPQEEYANADTEAFLQNLITLENKIKADALTYSKDWFGKDHKIAEVVDALWTPMLKYSKNKINGEPDLSKKPTLRIKIPKWEGVWKVEIYDEDGNKMFPSSNQLITSPLELLTKGINVACLLQCGGIWIANGKFGITWKLIQAVAQKPRENLTGQCYIKLNTTDKDKLKNAPLPQEKDDIVEIPTTLVDDSDVDEDDDIIATKSTPPEPTPAPVVAPEKPVDPIPETISTPAPPTEEKKKKVVKKKTTE